MIILTTCVCSLVLLQTTTFDKIERNRFIYIQQKADTQKTLVYAKQIVQLLLITVSKDEKPLSLLQSNNKLRHTYSQTSFPYSIVVHFPHLHIGPAISSPAFSAPAFLTVPHFPVSHFQSPRCKQQTLQATKTIPRRLSTVGAI